MSKKKIFANCTGIPSLFLQECAGTLLCWALEAVGWVGRPYAKRQEAPLCKILVALMPSFVLNCVSTQLNSTVFVIVFLSGVLKEGYPSSMK